MAEELKELIEKINEEAVKAATEKSEKIVNDAIIKAKAIVEKAQHEAEEILTEGKEKIARMEEASNASIKQAARDLVISLRKEITAMLDRLIVSHVHKTLDPEELTKIIKTIIRESTSAKIENTIISLKKEDIEKLERGFLSELRNETKKGIILKPSEDIKGGFIISYDSGRSYYDFTDKAVANYISFYLRPKLAEMLKESIT